MNWNVAEKISEEFKNRFPEIPGLILQLLYNRGIDTQEKIDEFLNPDYSQDIHDSFIFLEMEKVVERIFQAIKNKEKTVIYGDYDADGVCSAALLYLVLKFLGKTCEVYLPSREIEGYGLNKEIIKKFSQKKVNLIITVDCGMSDKKEVKLAQKLGMEVIIIDHHLELYEVPSCLIINPRLKREKYPFKELAGVGVVFKVAQALFKKIQNQSTKQKVLCSAEHINMCSGSKSKIQNEAFEKWLLDLVAIGTVADLVPLLGENRTLVKYGLIVLNKTKKIGLKELIKISNSEGNLDSFNLSQRLTPRLNAASRMDHASVAFELLISEDQKEAEKLSQDLNLANEKRQKITNEFFKEIKEKIEIGENKIIFSFGNYPIGIISLLANKTKDEFNLPVIILTKVNNKIVASVRSLGKFDISQVLEKMKEYFIDFGGHSRACGFTLKDESILEDFRKKITKIVNKKLKDLDLNPSLFIDSEITLDEINWESYEDIIKFEPFGMANKRPYFLIKNAMIINLERVGINEKHLKFKIQNSKFKVITCLGFNLGNSYEEKIKIGDKIDMIIEMMINEWNGNRELQLRIIDLKLAT